MVSARRAFVIGLVLCGILLVALAAPPKKKENKSKNVEARGLVSEFTSPSSILRNYATYSPEDQYTKRFSNPTLAFVTPWNNHGYDVAKIFNAKFTYVAPVWFQVKRENDRFVVKGQHDIDQGWIQEVRDNKGKFKGGPKIVPRYLFENWSLADYKELLSRSDLMQSVASLLSSEVKKYEFDGAVLDFSYLSMSDLGAPYVEFIAAISTQFRKNKHELILVVPPYFDGARSLFTTEEYQNLFPHVDQFLMMTYDYGVHTAQRTTEGDGSAPVHWMTQCLLNIIPPNQRGVKNHKIMLGLNFFGVQFSQQGSNAIIFRDYLEILEHQQPTFNWNSNIQEHVFSYYTKNGQAYTVYYPTLKYIGDRLQLAKDFNVGIGIWEVGQGLDYFYDLF